MLLSSNRHPDGARETEWMSVAVAHSGSRTSTTETAVPESRLAAFRCDVDDLPEYVGNRPDEVDLEAGALVLDGSFRVGEPPEWRFLRLQDLTGAAAVPAFSLRDPRTHVTYPFWATGESHEFVAGLDVEMTATNE